jgi:sugar O-acyltransferase (sialic acid O-acetyltransferase NeuD family)
MINNDKKIYILGAGGFAREIYSYLAEDKFSYNGYELAGFLTDNKDDLIGFDISHPILGSIKEVSLPVSAILLMGVTDCSFKNELYQFYHERGFEFLTYIHNTAFVGQGVILGEGCVLKRLTTFSTNISLGKCVTINSYTSMGHDSSIGDFSTSSGHCDITGYVKIGKRVLLGSRVSIIPKRAIADDSTLGAGSVVITNVKTNTTVFGNPAKKIK